MVPEDQKNITTRRGDILQPPQQVGFIVKEILFKK